MRHNPKESTTIRTIQLTPGPHLPVEIYGQLQWATVYPVFFPSELFKDAKYFWQHTGEGISSRRAEYCNALFDSLGQWDGSEQLISLPSARKKCKPGNQGISANMGTPIDQSCFYIEEGSEKHQIRSAITAMVSESSKSVPESDVFLYPSGMSAIWNLSKAIQACGSTDTREVTVTYG